MNAQPDPLRVDAGMLHAGGTKITTAVDSARTALSTSQSRMEDAMSGWSPASSAAMIAKLDQWKLRTDTLTSDIAAHGDSIKAAAARYAAQDSMNEKRLRTANDRM